MSTNTATAYRTWMCVVCGFIYNEAPEAPSAVTPRTVIAAADLPVRGTN